MKSEKCQKTTKPTGRQLVESYIRKHDGSTHTEITRALNIKTVTVGSAIALLKRDRVIESRGIPGQMRHYIIPPAAETNEPVFGMSPGVALFNSLLAGVRV